MKKDINNPDESVTKSALVEKVKFYNFNIITLVFYSTHILLNFMQTKVLMYFYIIELLFFFYLAFTKRWNKLLIPTLAFILIEGQGRVLLGYNLILKNIFDIYIIVLILRDFIQTRKLVDFKKIPIFLAIPICLHFLVYFIQFFNYQSLGPLAVLLAAKIYILPIFMFFMFIKQPMDFSFKKIITFSLIFFILLQSLLIFEQMKFGESQLLSISPHYFRILKNTFIGSLFRPFGTSFIFGGPSVLFPYFIGLFFLIPSTKKVSTIKFLVICIMFFAAVTMQVRTSLLQMFIVSIFVALTSVMASKKKIIYLPLILVSMIMTPIAIFQNIGVLDEVFPKYNLSNSLQRIESLSEVKTLGKSRATPSLFYDTLVEKLSKTPLGLGPGRTGAANSPFVNKIKNDLLFGMDYSWTLDNLFISLAIDFGYGMIFYSFVIIMIPIYILWHALIYFKLFRKNNRFLTIPGILCFIILISNWGAIAIPYNPVSFFFWFFAALAFNQIHKAKHEHIKEN